MKVTTVSHGGIVKLYLIPENELEKEAIKQLQGGRAELVTGNSMLEAVSLTDALVISNKIGKDEKVSFDNAIDSGQPDGKSPNASCSH